MTRNEQINAVKVELAQKYGIDPDTDIEFDGEHVHISFYEGTIYDILEE